MFRAILTLSKFIILESVTGIGSNTFTKAPVLVKKTFIEVKRTVKFSAKRAKNAVFFIKNKLILDRQLQRQKLFNQTQFFLETEVIQ